MGVSQTVMSAMSSSTAVMQGANEKMNIGEISTMIKDFQKAGMKMEMN